MGRYSILNLSNEITVPKLDIYGFIEYGMKLEKPMTSSFPASVMFKYLNSCKRLVEMTARKKKNK